MKLYNFTNHEQSHQIDFFKQYGFDEVTAPMHPEVTPEMSEEKVVETVKAALPKDVKDADCYTLRQLDAQGRFVFAPIDLREYTKVSS